MEENIKSIGQVKWFGEYNSKTGNINNYGFIENIKYEDIFVHKKSLINVTSLNEFDLVVYEKRFKNNKYSAENVYLVGDNDEVNMEFLNILLGHEKNILHTNHVKSLLRLFINKINPRFFKQFSEDEFLHILNINERIDAEEKLRLIGVYIEDIEIGNNLLNYIIDILKKDGLIFIIRSNNFHSYIKYEFIKNEIFNYLENKITSLDNSDISIIFKAGLISINKLLNNKNFILYSFDNLKDNEDFVIEFKKLALTIPNDEFIIDIISSNIDIFYFIYEKKDILDLINQKVSLSLMPDSFLNDNLDKLKNYINNITDIQKKEFISDNFNKLPIEFILYSCFEKDIDLEKNLIENRLNEFHNFINNELINGENSSVLIDNIKKLLNCDLNQLSKTKKIILEHLYFLNYLFQKNKYFIQVYEESISLKNSIKYFILKNLFSLIIENNPIETAFLVFKNKLWTELNNETINIYDDGLLDLFPSCGTLDYNLSCEAVYWPKGENYLCRGRLCRNPQIIPDSKKNYLNYNIYDWFFHYGKYSPSDGNFSKKDFPIKLAGYFNRLKEIWSVLKCRNCGLLMYPDMKYARTEYYEFEPVKNEVILKQMAAAYRVTVFGCNNKNCIENGKKYYINHCIGFGCYSIIDSRDLFTKCERGLYICRNCGSCCEQCAKEHPNGFCPDCGKELILYEKNGNRFVYCSNSQCHFNIPQDLLPKKFKLPSAIVKYVK